MLYEDCRPNHSEAHNHTDLRSRLRYTTTSKRKWKREIARFSRVENRLAEHLVMHGLSSSLNALLFRSVSPVHHRRGAETDVHLRLSHVVRAAYLPLNPCIRRASARGSYLPAPEYPLAPARCPLRTHRRRARHNRCHCWSRNTALRC